MIAQRAASGAKARDVPPDRAQDDGRRVKLFVAPPARYNYESANTRDQADARTTPTRNQDPWKISKSQFLKNVIRFIGRSKNL
jgi:hypothetical protein